MTELRRQGNTWPERILFAVSSAAFVFAGMGTVLGIGAAILVFLVLLVWGIAPPMPREGGKHWLWLLPLCGFAAAVRCGKLYFEISMNGSLGLLFSKLNLYHTPVNSPLGWWLLTGLVWLASLYCLAAVALQVLQVKKQEADKSEKKTLGKGLLPAVLLLISLGYTFIASVCNPTVTWIPAADHSIFYAMGKFWGEGLVPYARIFDHKGPFIFFLYMVGIALGERWGLFLLQVLALWASLWFACRCIRVKTSSPFALGAGILGILIFLKDVEYGFAITEEFNLPFLMASAWLAVRYLDSFPEKKEHPPVWAGVYGFAFAVALCTRLTNGAAVAVWVAVIVAVLLANKRFWNLLQNALGFLLGFALLVVPFVLYFWSQGALYDFLYGTLLYNLFSATKNSWEMTGWIFWQKLVQTWPVWSLVLISLFGDWKKHKLALIANLLAAAASVYVTFMSQSFGHYSMILAVFIPIGIGALASHGKGKQLLSRPLCALLALLLLAQTAQLGLDRWAQRPEQSQPELQSCAREIAARIPQEDRDSVIGYNVESRFYLYADIAPCFKYFTLQDVQSANSPAMQQENARFYRSGQAKWVLVSGDIAVEAVKNAIGENYTLLDSFSYQENGTGYSMLLYQRNE